MMGIRIRRAERNQERYVRWGGERYAVVSGPSVLFNCRGPYGSREASVVHLSDCWKSDILAMRRGRGRPSELNGSAAVCKYPGWIARTSPVWHPLSYRCKQVSPTSLIQKREKRIEF